MLTFVNNDIALKIIEIKIVEHNVTLWMITAELKKALKV
jgi:hypothetical protein